MGSGYFNRRMIPTHLPYRDDSRLDFEGHGSWHQPLFSFWVNHAIISRSLDKVRYIHHMNSIQYLFICDTYGLYQIHFTNLSMNRILSLSPPQAVDSMIDDRAVHNLGSRIIGIRRIPRLWSASEFRPASHHSLRRAELREVALRGPAT